MKLYKYFESFDLKPYRDYFYFIGEIDDYKKHKNYYNLITIDELKLIQRDPIFKTHNYVYTKLGIINMNGRVHMDEVLIPKRTPGPYLFLMKEKTLENYKNYKNIDDLIENENIAIYYSQGILREVYCYNINTLESLFFITLNKSIKNPYESWTISRTVADPDVSGKNILYPIGAYFAGGIITSSRDSVKEVARYVWKDFFDDSSADVNKYFPIDDKDFSITPLDEDDGVSFKNTKYEYNLILEILNEEINEMKKEDKDLFQKLLHIENRDNLDEILKSNSDNIMIKKIISYFDNVKKINFNKKSYCDRNDYVYHLLSFITKKLYTQVKAIEVLKKIQESFLNWTYELTDNSIGPKIKILTERHKKVINKKGDIKTKIIKSTEDLWEKRYG